MNQRAELEPAYLDTDYEVDAPDGTLAIQIGAMCAPLDELLARHGHQCWAYVTACNPRSRVLPDDENDRRMQDFERAVADAGFAFHRGRGTGHQDWPPESSLLILDMDEEQAHELADRFEQHAFVFGRRSELARLIWVKKPA